MKLLAIGNRYIFLSCEKSWVIVLLFSRYFTNIDYKSLANLSFFGREFNLYFILQIQKYLGTGPQTRTDGDENLIINS